MGRRILWIEDDYFHLKSLARPLVKMGFEIVPAHSVVEARQSLARWGDYDLILLDLILPMTQGEEGLEGDNNVESFDDVEELMTRNGRELLNYIVSKLKVSKPILVLSVAASAKLAEDLVSAGAAQCVVKRGLLPEDLKKITVKLLCIDS